MAHMLRPVPPPDTGLVYTGIETNSPTETTSRMFLIVFPWFPLVLAYSSIAARFWSRNQKKIHLGADDWLCLLVALIATGCQISVVLSVYYGGNGRLMTELSLTETNYYIRTQVAGYLLWVCAVGALQVSILLLYLRIFPVPTAFRISCYAAMGMSVSWMIISFCLGLFSCDPIESSWNVQMEATCHVDKLALCDSTGLIHVLLDFFILFLPAPVIIQLQMNFSRKLLLIGIFSIGLMATLCALLRLECLVKLVKVEPEDTTQEYWVSNWLQILALCLGVFAACVPTMAPAWTLAKESRAGLAIRRFYTRISPSKKKTPTSVKMLGVFHVALSEHTIDAERYTSQFNNPQNHVR